MRASAGVPALVAVLPVAAVAVLGAVHASTAAGGGCSIPPGSLQSTTAHHLFALAVGPMETMYSPSEAATRHPSSGEIMLGGAMAGVSGPPATVRHLEVHICSADGGQVVQSANPVIALTDLTARSAPEPVPVAVMEGVGQGVADLHYGNNVLMPPGHTYLVTIAAGGDAAAFTFTLGPDGITWGEPTMAAPAAAAATPAPGAMGSMSPGTGAASPAPATPPGTGAPTPRTGLAGDAAPAAGLGAAVLGGVLWTVGRRRR